MTMKKVLALVLSLCLVAALVACGGGSSSASTPADGGSSTAAGGDSSTAAGGDVEPIKIAALYPHTGASADNGLYCVKALDVAVEVVNAQGGIKSLGGAMLEVVHADLMSDVNQVKTVGERVLSDDEIVAGVGAGGSNYSIPLLPVFEKAGVSYLTGNVADAISNQGYKCVMQYSNNSTNYGPGTALFLDYLNERGEDIKKVAFLHVDTDYGNDQANAVSEQMKELGYEVVYKESFPTGMTDASALVANLKMTDADLLFPTADAQETKIIMNTMSSMDYFPLVYGGGSGFLLPAFAAEMGDAVNGMVSTAMANWDQKNIQENPEFKAYVDAYFEKHNSFPVEQGVSAMQAIDLIRNALEESGSRDKAVIMETLRGLNIPAIVPSGNIEFDENGLNYKCQPTAIQWQKDPETGEYMPRCVYPAEYVMDGVDYQKPGTAS